MAWKDPYAEARAQDLLPEEVQAEIPKLKGRKGEESEWVPNAKLFTPYADWRWYILEFDPVSGDGFALVHGHEMEFGYFNINDMAEAQDSRVPGLMLIERDMYWTPRPVKQIIEEGRSV